MGPTYRNRFVEFTPRWGLAFNYCRFEEHDSIQVEPLFGNFFFMLPWRSREPDGMLDQWGVTYFERGLHFHWGEHTKIIWLPWDWKHVRWTHWNAAGQVYPEEELAGVYGEERLNKLHAPEVDYTYTLKSGAIQQRKARYYVTEGEWRWRACPWLPWPRIIRKYIDIEFDGEVGEGSGSWKGGTLGCSYTLRRGETALACLRRMEAERTFD